MPTQDAFCQSFDTLGGENTHWNRRRECEKCPWRLLCSSVTGCNLFPPSYSISPVVKVKGAMGANPLPPSRRFLSLEVHDMPASNCHRRGIPSRCTISCFHLPLLLSCILYSEGCRLDSLMNVYKWFRKNRIISSQPTLSVCSRWLSLFFMMYLV